MPETAAMPGMSAQPGAGAAPPPQATPSGEPQQAKGDIEQAKANVHIAVKMLETTLSQLGAATPEGQAVMKALQGLTKVFSGKNQKSEDLVPAELLNVAQGLPDQYKQSLAQPKPGGMPGV